jgi:hypothetical protein
MFGSIPPLTSLDECLSDPMHPIGMRMRAAYFLRHIHSTSPENQENVVRILEKGLLDPHHGSLLRHEFAYVMGQMKDDRVRIEIEKMEQYAKLLIVSSPQCSFFSILNLELFGAGEGPFERR